MNTSRRVRSAADIALGYAADSAGRGIAYAAIGTGNATSTVRLTFNVQTNSALDGHGCGYGALNALALHLKQRGFGRFRIRLADARVAAELSGAASPPKSLAMTYVRIRCALRSLGLFRLEAVESADVRDLTLRAQAEVSLHVAA